MLCDDLEDERGRAGSRGDKWTMQKNRKVIEWERLEISSRKL